jgi:hypothetical protein
MLAHREPDEPECHHNARVFLELADIAFAELGAPQNIATGFTTDPTSLAAFNYFSSGGVAQLTNNLTASSLGNADQPWVLVNADPTTTSQDDTYVAYVDLSAANWNMRVAASYGAKPPNFTVDNIVGTVPGPVNGSDPGLRIAKDTASGAMFALWETCASNCSTPSPTFNYVLNRSVDGGHNWSLGGSTLGTNIASGVSTQPGKFGGVNALIGGVLHGAVNPADHSVYYVYGTQDTVTGNNRLGLRRVVADAAGNATVGPERFVTGEVQAALPQVAVDSAGNVGVFYYTFDGNGSGGLPNFTAHIAISDNQGATFTTSTLVAFQSPVPDSGASRQRILGDYEQMKSVGNCFHGAFAANGFALGRTVGATNTAVAMDPAYFQVCGVETAALRQIVGTATALPLPAGNVNITGDFTPVGPLNLNTATVTLQKVLTDGAGEHVQGIPITLAALPGGSTTAASYLSIVVPTVAMQIAQVPLLGDFVQLNIAVDGVTRPPSCGLIVGAASLSTQFKIDDGVHPPLVVSGSNTWACAGPELIAP